MKVSLRWQDDVGKPIVTVENGRVVSMWAALDIELRNLAEKPQRISDIYMVFRKARPFWQVIGRAEPVRVDTDFNWHRRDKPTRLEWLLEPIGKAEKHNVVFNRDYGRNNPNAPEDPKQFEADVVAELGTEEKKVRVRLGTDIMTQRPK